jgi:hypothetical protein
MKIIIRSTSERTDGAAMDASRLMYIFVYNIYCYISNCVRTADAIQSDAICFLIRITDSDKRNYYETQRGITVKQ